MRWCMVPWLLLGALAGLGGWPDLALAQAVPEPGAAAPTPMAAPTGLTEADYFEELPVVLTVSRLAQSIGDTPGAVTVIDRDTIRRSGARDLSELLRLVPGYMVSGFNGANPTVAYHAPIDEYGARNLVLVNGRSLYSTAYQGGANRGMQTVLVDDVERLEVLRGTNSAAYGANAVFGVINIVTRHTSDSLGASAAVASGGNGLRDFQFHYGWGGPDASYRLSGGQRSDDGYFRINDSRRLNNLRWRGDIRLDAGTELLLEAGFSEQVSGEGFPGNIGNLPRDNAWSNLFLNGVWSRQITPTESVKWSLSFDEDRLIDAFPFPPDPTVIIDFGNVERRLDAEFQHQTAPSDQFRLVWGAGVKQDSAVSRPMFGRPGAVKSREYRLFGNAEWEFAPQWVLNAGLFVGDNSRTGSYLAPRLMLNRQLTPDHTLRAGVSRGQRAPTLFELDAQVVYTLSGGTQVRSFTGNPLLSQEEVNVQEISYFGHFRDARVTVDVRAYREKLTGIIESFRVIPSPFNDELRNFANRPGLKISGVEWQVRWSPTSSTELWWNQSFTELDWLYDPNQDSQPPDRSTTLALLQKLPHQWDLTLLVSARDRMAWRKNNNGVGSTTRVDLRLAHQFQLGHSKAEAALVWQALNGDQAELDSVRERVFKPRLFATFRVEF
jgi:iron complex outermembrane recepter protein